MSRPDDQEDRIPMTAHLSWPDPKFEPHEALAPDGTLLEDDEIDIGTLEQIYKTMLCARRFDERLLKLQRQGALGTFAPIKGQEAAQIGAAACLREDDWLVPSFRETGAALWRGADMADLLVTLAGWNAGNDLPEGARTLPDTVPVASQLPIAVGIAHAGRLRGEDAIVMACFGDGATSEGDFHEALNFAGVLEAPVVFLCQNNGWAISTPRARQTASQTLAQKAHAYGIPAAQVDGNDALAVMQVTQEAVALARDKGQPAMIEALTYRMEVHTTADDPTRYRDEGEVEEWQDRDPIERVRKLLVARSQLDDAMQEALEEEIRDRIDAAWSEARDRISRLEETPGTAMFDHIFAEPTAPLRRQRKEFSDQEEAAND